MLQKLVSKVCLTKFSAISMPIIDIQSNFYGLRKSSKDCQYSKQFRQTNMKSTNKYFFCGIKDSNGKVTQQFKDQSRKFYQTQVQNIIELQKSSDWEPIIAGIRQPLIIDLYADWCAPCKKLTPKLENKVRELEKQNKNVKLLKVNIDKCAQIAQALQVKSVPTVYLLYMGQAVDGFQGDVPQQQLNKFFETIKKIFDTTEASKESVMLLEQAKTKIQQAKYQQAIIILEKFKGEKNREDFVAIKQIFLTQCYLSLNKFAKFKQSVAKASLYQAHYRLNPDMHKFFLIMKQQLEKLEQDQKEDPQISQAKAELQKYEDNNPSNKQKRLNLKYKLAELYKQKQMPQQSLQIALEIIKQDKNWQDKKSNKFVLQSFKDLGGNQSIIVQKYRKILQRLLN